MNDSQRTIMQGLIDMVLRCDITGGGVLAAQRAARDASSALVESEPCWCDRQGIGEPGVSCGDCPTRDYKQKPVAITTKTQIEEMHHGYSRSIVGRDPKFWFVKRDDDVPLYTVPPRQEWHRLTDEERQQIIEDVAMFGAKELCSAIEIALKEKNQ